MNILLMTNSMKQPDDEFAGKTDVVFSFAREWAKEGHRVVVIHNESKFPIFYYKLPKGIYSFLQKRGNVSIPSISSREVLRREENGIKVYRIPMLKIIPHSRYTKKQYEKQEKLIIDYLKRINFVPSVITGHWIEPQLWLIHNLGVYYHAKTGFVLHGEIPSDLNQEYKKYIKQLNCFFLRSQTCKKRALDKYSKDFLTCKVKVCYSGIPNSYIENITKRCDWKKEGVFRIVYVGRLVAYKRIDAILNALSQIRGLLNFRFEVIGDGVELDNLRALSKELRIDDRVTFHGRISRDRVQNLLHESDCFTMISENEVFGLVYLEAMAAGCVTVASYNGGVDGIINNNINGFLCHQGDSKELCKVLKHISELDVKRVNEIREKAYDTVSHYTDSQVAEDYLDNIVN